MADSSGFELNDSVARQVYTAKENLDHLDDLIYALEESDSL